MPLKPDKYGIKIWMICEVASGYCTTFEVYSGQTEENAGAKIFALVFRLLASGRLLDRGYQLFGDRLFTSPQLVHVLLQRCVGYCGTVKARTKGETCDWQYCETYDWQYESSTFDTFNLQFSCNTIFVTLQHLQRRKFFLL